MGNHFLVNTFNHYFCRAFLPPNFRVYHYDNAGIMRPLDQHFQVCVRLALPWGCSPRAHSRDVLYSFDINIITSCWWDVLILLAGDYQAKAATRASTLLVSRWRWACACACVHTGVGGNHDLNEGSHMWENKRTPRCPLKLPKDQMRTH